MASDHQTQAGKTQPLNPKVGTMQRGGGGQAELIPQTQSPFCKVGLASAFPSLLLCPWVSVSPTCTLGADSEGPSLACQNSHYQLPASES